MPPDRELSWRLLQLILIFGKVLVHAIGLQAVVVKPWLASGPHTAACSLCPCGMRRRIRRVKERKLVVEIKTV